MRQLRTLTASAALGLSLVINAVLMLPVLPVHVLGATPVVGIDYDAGETVGWPRFVVTIRSARQQLPADARVSVGVHR